MIVCAFLQKNELFWIFSMHLDAGDNYSDKEINGPEANLLLTNTGPRACVYRI